jgi:hypothetical protein
MVALDGLMHLEASVVIIDGGMRVQTTGDVVLLSGAWVATVDLGDAPFAPSRLEIIGTLADSAIVRSRREIATGGLVATSTAVALLRQLHCHI